MPKNSRRAGAQWEGGASYSTRTKTNFSQRWVSPLPRSARDIRVSPASPLTHGLGRSARIGEDSRRNQSRLR